MHRMGAMGARHFLEGKGLFERGQPGKGLAGPRHSFPSLPQPLIFSFSFFTVAPLILPPSCHVRGQWFQEEESDVFHRRVPPFRCFHGVPSGSISQVHL